MQRYLNHLLADLEMAIRNAPATSLYRFRHPFDSEEDRDASSMQVRYVRLCDLFGLSPGIFPPSERLTKEQVANLLGAIERLWRAWNIDWDCPPRLTARRRYTVMVERMEHDPVRYSHEYGATINFCDHRADGNCPFGDSAPCWCNELEACAQHDQETWELATDLDFDADAPASPVEELYRWLDEDHSDIPIWISGEENDSRWKQFTNDSESLAWLFFYDPQRARELQDEDEQLKSTSEDFEDFDWLPDDDEDDYGELPF